MTEDGSSSTAPISLLLVDDREEDLLALEVLLEGPELRLVKATSGPEALRAVLHEDFAVILLDVQMPGMRGFEVAEIIKKRERTRHIPIIFLTAERKDVETLYEAYEIGAVDFIPKPLDPNVVRAKVAVFVELHRRGEEIRRQADLLRLAERRRREAELAELRGATERRYRSLADAIPQLVWTGQPDGEASYFNQRWTAYSGFSAAQLLGSRWQALLHPVDVPRFLELWQHARGTGEPLRTELRLRSATGGYRWHLAEVLAERDDHEVILGWLGTFTDVNEQKQLEEERARALRREQGARVEAETSVHRLELLAEANHLLTRSLDVQGILDGLAELVTPRLASWCVVDVLAEDGAVAETAFAHEDDALRPLGKGLAEGRSRGRPADGEAQASAWQSPEVSPDPCDPRALAAALGAAPEVVERLGVAAYVSVPLAARGRVLGAMTLVSAAPARALGPAELALAADLGQRAALAVDNARLYGEAQRAVRLRDEFLSIASHELRTPLSALDLQVQSMRVALGRDPVDVDRLRAKSLVVARQVERFGRLIGEMLDVARIEAGRLELDREEVDLAGLVREVAARFDEEIQRAGSALELSVEGEIAGAWDRSRLDQVVANLLQNAVKYGEGRPIRVRLQRDGAAALLRVEDRGIGIAAADQQRIFGRFERAVSARQHGGMGVGLFIVDQIVTAHGGHIEVRSQPGEGSTFDVRLPL